jgi:hypothetical protein
MKKKENKISLIISITGVVASITSFIYGTNIMAKINVNLFIGILSSIFASLLVYVIFYLKDFASELSKTKNEIDFIRKSIKELVEQKKKKAVFLSYNHKDREIAQRISRELEKADLQIWDYEKEIKVGQNWKESIYNALNKSDYFVYLISKSTSESNFISQELQQALEKNKKILPILIDDSKPEEFVSSIKYVNLKDDYLEGIEELLKSFKADLESQPNKN